MLLCGRCGGVSGWTDPSTVQSRSSPARWAIAASSCRRTCQSARLQSAGPTSAGPVTDMIRLCGEQVAPSGKWMIRAPARRACRMRSRTSWPLCRSWPLSRGSSRTTICAVASRTGFSSGMVSPCRAGRTCRRAAAYDSPVFAVRARTRRLRFLLLVIWPSSTSRPQLPQQACPRRTDLDDDPRAGVPLPPVTSRAGAGRRRLGVGHARTYVRQAGESCQPGIPWPGELTGD